jgi:S1-C subfamily serine protease
MTHNRDASELWVSAAEAAGNSLVHVSAGCRRGATGHLFGAEGLVVTTARAVAGREQLEVAQGDRETPARVVGYDAATDLAVVQPEATLGEPPAWTDGPLPLGLQLLSATRPGRAVRVRLGMVSQLGGPWHSLRGGRIERYVETDLAPEPGFSGGLAFDSHGRAVGMTSAGLLRGVPLLLEKPTLDRVVAAISKDGRVRRGYLGVGTQAVRLAEPASSTGLLVTSVQPGSPADRAGLLLGDVLLELGGSVLGEWGALQAALEDSEGRVLPLSLVRAGQPLRLDVTPGVRS